MITLLKELGEEIGMEAEAIVPDGNYFFLKEEGKKLVDAIHLADSGCDAPIAVKRFLGNVLDRICDPTYTYDELKLAIYKFLGEGV